MTGRYNYLDSNRYAQVFANKSFFDAAYPMEKNGLTGQVLREFIVDFGVIDDLFCDISK